jgi:hypothetical protein
MFWPYRPREGFPSVPRWLMIVLLIVGAIVYVAASSITSQSTRQAAKEADKPNRFASSEEACEAGA